MRGVSTTQRDIEIGHRLVSVARIEIGLNKVQRLADPQIERVTAIDEDARRMGHNMRLTLEGPSGARDIYMAHTGFNEQGPRRVIWSDPLPEDDEVAIALVSAARMATEGRQSILLWIGGIDSGIGYCHQVTDQIHAEDNLVVDGGYAHTPYGIPVLIPDGIGAGALIGVDRLCAEIVDGRCVHKPANVHVVMGQCTLKQATDMPVARRRRSTFSYGNFGGLSVVTDAEELAQARAEPSEALVVVWMDGDSQQTHVLGTTGIAFHRQDDVAIYLEDKMPGIGLWLFANASMHGSYSHEGEYDQDLDGDAVPADHAAIERLFGPVDEIAREMVEVIGDPVEADELIAQAIKSDADDRAATEAANAKHKAELEQLRTATA